VIYQIDSWIKHFTMKLIKLVDALKDLIISFSVIISFSYQTNKLILYWSVKEWKDEWEE